MKRSLKEAAKKGDKDVCLVYAKELIRSKKAISKIYTSKAHLNSIQMHMKEQLGTFHSSFPTCNYSVKWSQTNLIKCVSSLNN